jgi:DHA1 family tetracycline resistance protein-like MFS transporter
MANTHNPAVKPPATKGLTPLLAINFAGSLGYTIVMPFMMFLVTQWGGNAVVYGMVSAAYPAFQLIGAPLLGRWSDVWGRKRVLVLSEAGSTFSWIIVLIGFYVPMTTLADLSSNEIGTVAVTLPLILLFIGRALDGLTGGNVSVANAYVSDISSPAQRDTNFGKLAASSNVGAMLGPALASLMVGTALGYELPVLAAIAVCLVATLMVIFGLSQSGVRTETTGADPAPRAVAVGTCHNSAATGATLQKIPATDLLHMPCIALLVSATFFINLAFSFFNVALPVYSINVLHWTPHEMALFYVMMSVVMVLVEGPGLRRATAVCNNFALIAIGGLVLALGFASLSSHSTAWLFVGAGLIGVGNGLMWPLLISMIAKRGGEHQGAVQGLATSTGAFAAIIGLIAGGLLYTTLQGGLFILAALFTLVVVVLSLWAEKHDK